MDERVATDVFVWCDRLLTGERCVDEEHRQIIRLINRGHELQLRNGCDAACQVLLDELIAFLRDHLKREEQLMVQERCDARHIHLQSSAHQELSWQVKAMRQFGSDSGVAQSLLRYVSKPWNDQDIQLIVRHALERKALEREKERLEALTARQNDELKALNAGLELRVKERTQELRGAHEKLKTSFLTSIKVFANLIELRGSFLAGHSRRVADLARRIAGYMKLESTEGQDVFLAGLLHDIGKIGLPDDLLSKPVSQFTGLELGQYRKHPVKGEQSLMALDELHGAAEMLRAHHERFDGQGFPDGLSGDAIPIGARILAVANDYDAVQIGNLSARRLSPEEARQFIVGGSGRRYDPAVVEAFLGVTGEPESHAEPAAQRRMTPSMLEPGMKLTRDFVTREGVLLLSADHVLSPGLIRQIQDYARSEGELIALYVR